LQTDRGEESKEKAGRRDYAVEEHNMWHKLFLRRPGGAASTASIEAPPQNNAVHTGTHRVVLTTVNMLILNST
jgi:hypothetical protein